MKSKYIAKFFIFRKDFLFCRMCRSWGRNGQSVIRGLPKWVLKCQFGDKFAMFFLLA